MSPNTDPSPGHRARPSERGDRDSAAAVGFRGWSVATVLAALMAGLLFAFAAVNSNGTDLRPGRYTDLVSLVRHENAEVERLTEQAQGLKESVAELAATVNDARVRELRRRAIELRAPAGLTPVSGPGVTVTLSDASEEVINSSSQDINLLVVHQQDIQAVVNAMWAGGAEAVMVQGQRLIGTSGIKCEGNAVQIQGVAYPQPYVISAVGDQAAILESIEFDGYLQTYREQASRPDISIGWDLSTQASLLIPGYTGLLALGHARPLR